MKKVSFSVFGNINIDSDKWKRLSHKVINAAQANSQPVLHGRNWLFVASDEMSFDFRETGFFEINVFKGKLDSASSILLGKDCVNRMIKENDILLSSIDWILIKPINQPSNIVEIDIVVS